MRPNAYFPPPSEHRAFVRGVFERVAERYDLMNDLMSFGLHRRWKQALAERVLPRNGSAGLRDMLDMACGSGDIALRCLAQAPAHVAFTLCDSNRDMLRQAQRRIDALPAGQAAGRRLRLLCAEAEGLPFAGRSFDAYTIAFGIRNASCIASALTEARRVLRPGGRFFCLEFSRAHLPGLEQAYAAYAGRAIPALGKWVVGDEAPYRYLVESIRRFPPPQRLGAMMEEAGFARVSWERLGGGIVALHRGWRL